MPRGKRYTAAERTKFAQYYAQGGGYTGTKAKFGISSAALYKALEDNGVKRKGPRTIPEAPHDAAVNTDSIMVYLAQGEKMLMNWIRSGRIRGPDPVHLQLLLALGALRGKN